MIPKTTSYLMIFLLKKSGSKSEAKKAPVDIMANVIDTLDIFIAEKKVNQCNAISSPTNKNFSNVLTDTFNLFFLKTIYNKTKKAPISILYQTNGNASIEINAPRTAVNPHINTMKCK